MPFGHAPNAIELDDGGIFVTWYCATHESCEDQRIAGSLRNADGSWEESVVLLRRFECGGETWIPETAVPVVRADGQLCIYFWAAPLSGYSLQDDPSTIDLKPACWWFSTTSITIEGRAWARNITTAQLFTSPVVDRVAVEPTHLLNEVGTVLYGRALKLQSGKWVLPLHMHVGNAWEKAPARGRFLISDENQENWRVAGADVFGEPGCSRPVIVQHPSGEVLCYLSFQARYESPMPGHIWKAISTDDRESFSEPGQTNLRNPSSGIDIALSSISGSFLIVYNDSYAERVPLSVGISGDGGNTLQVRDIEVKNGIYGYPKLLQTRDGLWHLFYSQNYHHIEHVSFDEDWLLSGRRVIGA